MPTFAEIVLEQVQPGDIAEHQYQDLDGREVAKISPKTNEVWLFLVTSSPAGPFPADNYTYGRWT